MNSFNYRMNSCSHPPTKIVIEEGQNVCMCCGMILEQFISQEAEWRYYGTEDRNDDPTRVGLTIHSLLPESSYGSMAMNKKTNSEQLRSIQRLSVWCLASNSERSWLTVMELMNGYAYRHGFTKAILQEACALFHSQEDALKLRGETRRALMGACFFLACRRFEVSRTHEEISEILKVSTRSLSKAIQRFGIILEDNPLLMTQLSLSERMMNGLSVNEQQRNRILDRIREVFKCPHEELSHTPKVMVAGIIAGILSESMDRSTLKSFLKDFSKHSGVSVVSIQKVMKA
jgi:transcription initiation factor TFIIIB Brf1 subunit/transcription initiation factor TFIIB